MIIRDTEKRSCYIFAPGLKDDDIKDGISAFLDEMCTEDVLFSSYSPFGCPVWTFDTDDEYDFSLLMCALSKKYSDLVFFAVDEDDMCIANMYWKDGMYSSNDVDLPCFCEDDLEQYMPD